MKLKDQVESSSTYSLLWILTIMENVVVMILKSVWDGVVHVEYEYDLFVSWKMISVYYGG